jgi:hypothetical protein
VRRDYSVRRLGRSGSERIRAVKWRLVTIEFLKESQ